MRRLPLPEIAMAGIVAVAVILIARAMGEARVLKENELACFRMMGHLDRSGPVPAELARIGDGPVHRHHGYCYAAYVAGEDEPVVADLPTVLAGSRPYVVLAWPERWEVTGRCAFVLRSPGYILQTENDREILTGETAPPCPWSTVADPTGRPQNPEEGAPEHWRFAHRTKQRERLLGLGLVYVEKLARHRRDDD